MFIRSLSSSLLVILLSATLLTVRGDAQQPPGGNRTQAGEFIVDHPTLINLGFEWMIGGDDNRNASVTVRYRKTGTADWKPALPLLRLQGEEIYNGAQLHVVSPNMFAGSILDLEPDSSYECELQMTDPDGTSGETRKTVTVRT